MQTPENPGKEESYSEEEVLKGIIYPPPPSFYQKVRVPEGVEEREKRKTVPERYTPEAARAAIGYTQPKGTEVIERGKVETKAGVGKQVKRSKRWMWVVSAIMGVALIASCSLCGWVGYSLFSSVFQEALGARDTINTYYSELQSKDYNKAYGYLKLEGEQSKLTREEYMQQAEQEDAQLGPILSYTPSTPAFSTDPSQGGDISQSTVMVQVGRKQGQYSVKLTLRREGNGWKISSYSRL